MTENEIIIQMMENQDRYFNWFMLILGIILVFVGVLQWRLSSKQIESIKEKTKIETIKEIQNSLGITSLEELSENITEPLKLKIDELTQLIEELKVERDQNDYFRFFYDSEREEVYENPIRHYSILIDIYKPFISSSEGNFNLFINKLKGVLMIPQNKGKKFDEEMIFNFKNMLVKLERIASENCINNSNIKYLKELINEEYDTNF